MSKTTSTASVTPASKFYSLKKTKPSAKVIKKKEEPLKKIVEQKEEAIPKYFEFKLNRLKKEFTDGLVNADAGTKEYIKSYMEEIKYALDEDAKDTVKNIEDIFKTLEKRMDYLQRLINCNQPHTDHNFWILCFISGISSLSLLVSLYVFLNY